MRVIMVVFICVMLLCTSERAEDTSSKTHRTTIPFLISKTGHIIVKVKINNKDACLVIDTAAGASVIHTKQIKYLGLKAIKGNVQVKGLGTSSHAMKRLKVSEMTIGKKKYLMSSFIALDLSHVEQAGGDKGFHGLLGSPFLQKYGAIINYEEKTLSLKCPQQTHNNKANKTNTPDKK
jgi:hypothetical protein